MSLDGSQRIEAKPRQDGGHAYPLKASSLSILFSPYVLVMRAWLPLSRLGVLVLSLMSTCLFMHVSSICRSSFYHLRNLSRIRKYFTKESAEVAVHAFVTSKLDYRNALLYGLPKYHAVTKIAVCTKHGG